MIQTKNSYNYMVSDADYTYSSFRDFAIKNNHTDAILDDQLKECESCNIIKNRIVKILITNTHPTTGEEVAIVETINKPYYKFIIGMKGLKEVV